MASRVLKTGENQITQWYGNGHNGIDLVKYRSKTDTIIAHSDGKVVFCQTGQKSNQNATGDASYGNCVKLDHGNGYATLYAHLASVSVKLGDTVKRGQTLGTMGNTGRSFGAHLHFELWKGGKRVDPTACIDGDLPTDTGAVSVMYKAYAGKWWPTVTDCHDRGTSGYAGVKGRSMSALLAKPKRGVLRYRVHLKEDGRWLPWVQNDSDYAGNLGETIDAVQMVLEGVDGYQVQYRVSAGDRWYGWCTGLTDKSGDGYAGVFGKAVDRIQIRIVAT